MIIKGDLVKNLFTGIFLLFILLVSHAYSADNLFVDNEDGSVTDLSTGLMWSKNTLGEMAQYVAITFCYNLELAGYDDWRLPVLDELSTLVDNNFSPTINTTFFPDTLDFYLSSENGFDVVYGINFNNGTIFIDYWSYKFFSRAVRTTQPCVPNADSDGDTVCDIVDNCPTIPNGPEGGTCTFGSDNPGANCTNRLDCINSCTSNGDCSMDQEDIDGDDIGDVCDPDDDNDGNPDSQDNCPEVPNGPVMGSCFNYYTHEVGWKCVDHSSCQGNPNEWYRWCDIFQNDMDADGIGDVCDPSPMP
jgi:hypothetical protein